MSVSQQTAIISLSYIHESVCTLHMQRVSSEVQNKFLIL
jgi:hypothetical protein